MMLILNIVVILILFTTIRSFQFHSKSLSRSISLKQFIGKERNALSWAFKPLKVTASGQRGLLMVLKSSKDEDTAQEISEAIYTLSHSLLLSLSLSLYNYIYSFLQELSSDDEENLELVATLASKVKGCNGEFHAFDVR
jgi:hypothetical protein